jgi:hypothetical protein
VAGELPSESSLAVETQIHGQYLVVISFDSFRLLPRKVHQVWYLEPLRKSHCSGVNARSREAK